MLPRGMPRNAASRSEPAHGHSDNEQHAYGADSNRAGEEMGWLLCARREARELTHVLGTDAVEELLADCFQVGGRSGP